MKRALVAMVTIGGLLLQFGFLSTAVAESPEVEQAFSRLDALAKELAGGRRPPGEAPGSTPASVPAPQPAGAPPTDAVGGAGADGETSVLSGGAQDNAPCGTAKEMEATIAALDERYESHGRAIIVVNDTLRSFRKALIGGESTDATLWSQIMAPFSSFRGAVIDDESICKEGLAEEVAATLARIEALEFAVDYREAGELSVCVGRLQKETDEEINAMASNIRMHRLTEKMERLITMSHRARDLEMAFQRGVNKRDRLVEELGQFQREIEDECQ